MKRARALLSGTACLLLFTACGEERDAEAAATPRVEIRGVIAAAQTANAAASLDGRLAAIHVAEGAAVRQGDLVATLASPALDRDLAYARAQVAVAEQRLREARRPIATSLILGDAGARERASAEILQTRENQRDRYRELFKSRDVTKEELENAEAAYAAALRDWLVERERASMKVVQTDTSVLRLELERAKAEQAFVNDRKAMLAVHAPIGGIVTRVVARPGESIYTRDPILEIANTATVDVHGAIAPELQRYVRPGTQVEVKVITVPPRRFTVPIRNIVPGNGNAIIVVPLPNPDGVLQAGQQAVITVK
ncbi:MAG TPA: efflux RND transporter periplasmic adaptor subunit [Thermoanaerobaculia bacterium]|nr:efflux RND transporter periplasmic adaptor subunit [Thermoanaerobaculia bacterium]